MAMIDPPVNPPVQSDTCGTIIQKLKDGWSWFMALDRDKKINFIMLALVLLLVVTFAPRFLLHSSAAPDAPDAAAGSWLFPAPAPTPRCHDEAGECPVCPVAPTSSSCPRCPRCTGAADDSFSLTGLFTNILAFFGGVIALALLLPRFFGGHAATLGLDLLLSCAYFGMGPIALKDACEKQRKWRAVIDGAGRPRSGDVDGADFMKFGMMASAAGHGANGNGTTPGAPRTPIDMARNRMELVARATKGMTDGPADEWDPEIGQRINSAKEAVAKAKKEAEAQAHREHMARLQAAATARKTGNGAPPGASMVAVFAKKGRAASFPRGGSAKAWGVLRREHSEVSSAVAFSHSASRKEVSGQL